jgi:hypothetical protein
MPLLITYHRRLTTARPAQIAGLAVIAAIMMSLGSCADRPSSNGLEEHPFLDKVMVDVRTIPRSSGTPDSLPGPLKAITERLREAREVSRFGARDTPRSHVFGDIADIVVVGDTVFMLDPTAGEVRLFSTQGVHLASLGSSGQGPNELADPMDLEVGANGKIAVLERSGIKIFSIIDHRLALDRLVMPTGAAGGASACMFLDSLFIVRTRGLRMDKQIHVFRSRGRANSRDSTELVTRFGDGYPFGDNLVRSRISRGPIACPTPDVVVTAYHDLPLVEAHGIDGAPLWKSGVTDFDPNRTLWGIDPEDGAPFIRNSRRPVADRVMVVTTLPGGFVLLQVGRLKETRAESGDPVVGIDSYVFDVDTGLGLFVGDNLPAIKYATETFLAGALFADDYSPQITIWRY